MTSPAPSDTALPTETAKKITFRFCYECSNLLYPQEDKLSSKLMYSCRSCGTTEPSTNSCVYRNELSNTVGETAGITQDVGSDPTVGDGASMSVVLQEPMPVCTMCGQEIVCEECGEAEAEGLFLEVDEPDGGVDLQAERVVSDPESDQNMMDERENSNEQESNEHNGHR